MTYRDMVELIPPDRVTFTLREDFLYMKSHKMTANIFSDLVIHERLNPKHLKILYHRASFYYKYKRFKTTGILPQIEDKGLQADAQQLCVDKQLKLFNSDVNATIGVAENNSQFVEYLTNVNEDYKKECG